MVATRRACTKRGGGDLLTQELVQTSSLSDILQDFQAYNQLLQEECQLVFRQLLATAVLLNSSSVSEFETEFGDTLFTQVRQAFDSLMNDIEAQHEFVSNTVFTEDEINSNASTSANTNTPRGGALRPRDLAIDLANTTPDYIRSQTTKVLLATIQRYETQNADLSLQQQENLKLCITEYQIKAMTSLNTLYLGDVSISCMLLCTMKNIEQLVGKYDGKGGDVTSFIKGFVTLAEKSASASKQIITNILTTAHTHVEQMPLNKKMTILQSLFADLLKWGGKQLMLRLRAPEFDISSISDMSDFKKEILSFIANRITQIISKTEYFRGKDNDVNTREQHLKWVLSVLENIESLLTFIDIIAQLSTTPVNVSMKMNVRASVSTGVKVNLEPSQWLHEIKDSVHDLKDIVTHKQANILNLNMQDIINRGREQKRQRDAQRQLILLNAAIKRNQEMLERYPNNNVIVAEIGRLETLKDKLIESQEKNEVKMEDTCVQLLHEIHSYVTDMEIPHFPLDIINKDIIQTLAVQVDHSAFSSAAKEAAGAVGSIENGVKAYIGCINKYMQFCPNIANVCKHIGFALPDLHNVIDKLGNITNFATHIMDGVGAYTQAANMCLLIIHLIVAASLNCRNQTINVERVTLDDIKRASQERIAARTSPDRLRSSLPALPTRGGKRSRKKRGGGYSLMASRLRNFDPRQSVTLSVQGRKSVLNERVRTHSIQLLDPEFTRSVILRDVLTNSIDSSSYIGKTLVDKVENFMVAYSRTLQQEPGKPFLSVLDNLKFQNPELKPASLPLNPVSSCSAIPSLLSSEEDVYILSIFARYQGEQLRNSFAFNPSSQKPSNDTLYCSVSQPLKNMQDERQQIIVASITTNFNGMPAAFGGGKKRTKNVRQYLEKKTSKELYAYATSKGLKGIKSKMRKDDLISEIMSQRSL